MTSLQRTTIGQQTELIRIMAKAYFDKEDVEAIIADENLAQAMYWGYFFEALKTKPDLVAQCGYKPGFVDAMRRKYLSPGGFTLQAQP